MKFLTYATPIIRNAMMDCIFAALSQFEQRMADKKDGPGFQRVYLDNVPLADEWMLRIESIAAPLPQTLEQIYIRKEQLMELYMALDKLIVREHADLSTVPMDFRIFPHEKLPCVYNFPYVCHNELYF